jgi:DNA modification methylase
MNCIQQESGENWNLIHGDCCEVITGIPENSIDFCIHSPPFASLYVYSDSESDMGNCLTTDEFIEHYKFLIRELLRVTVSGRLCAVHCMDLPLFKWRDGFTGRDDFPGAIIHSFVEAGWTYHSRVTIWKDPVLEQQRTKAHGLLHKTLKKDSSAVRQGGADYLLVFRKNTELGSTKPVSRPRGLDRYVGQSNPLNADYHPAPGASTGGLGDPSIEVWRRYAENTWWDLNGCDSQFLRAAQDLLKAGWSRQEIDSIFGTSETDAVWMDINQTDTLNYRTARDGNDERHICPLQMGLIERAIHLWTNPGDVVLTPFAGIGSEVVGAIRQGRKGIGIELKESYFKTACTNCRIEESHIDAPRLNLEAALPSAADDDAVDSADVDELADIGL